MGESTPTVKGWYPDDATGGTRYWDGARWSGDIRPARRPFAASSAHRSEGWSVLTLGGVFTVILVMSFLEEPTVGGYVGMVVGILAVAGASGAVGAYLLRGQGPTTEEVEQRLKEQSKDAKARRRKANIAGALAQLGRGGARRVPEAENADPAAEQVRALRDPQTAKALQDLQKLLYTRTLTEEEFRAAKDKLLGPVPDAPDRFAQLEMLADLHRRGVLGDLEFAAAKARVLGL